MSANTEPVFVGSALSVAVNGGIGCEITDADGTAAKAAVSGGPEGSLIQDLSVVSTDSVDADVVVSLKDGSSVMQLAVVTVPAGSGNSGTAAAVSLLNASNLPALNKRDDLAVLLGAGQSLEVGVVSAVSSGAKLVVTALGGNL